ncbi:hypothetical protein H4696_008646 [Amycolatopsis lexingtonensis]|uniref:Uncharacterized protein n=1 Tax=Amycolatopsis lexingtonensis TaxID=218822 RepID=A0ABR9IEG2_9PSEU|nr:hypothetical protein [Amycolatopsis lexingtonensis]MBE1501546.1 hypothetical protein [Amycolatopsis lexingtonensis]
MTRSPDVLNDSFRSSEVLNESFKTLVQRCGLHRRDFAGALASGEVNDSFMTLRAAGPARVDWSMPLGSALPSHD